ncbi:MAG: TRAP transporter small permease subunit [Pseudomonadota bacterium]|nr:TRAP transporter small permease subunit [Pseudomonadota bacterium]
MSKEKNGMDSALNLIDRLIYPVTLFAGGAALIGLSLITVIAVIFRYVFNSPIFGADDFNQMFLMATVAFGVAYSGRKGGQVVVEILTVVSGPRFTRWTDIFVKLLGFIMMTVLVWVLIESGINAEEYGETTRSLEITLQPFFWLLAFGMALYGIVLLLEMVALLRGRDLDY